MRLVSYIFWMEVPPLILYQSTCLSVEPDTRFPVDQGGRRWNGRSGFFRNQVRGTAIAAVFGASFGRQDIAILDVLSTAMQAIEQNILRCSSYLVEAREVYVEGVVVGGGRACGG